MNNDRTRPEPAVGRRYAAQRYPQIVFGPGSRAELSRTLARQESAGAIVMVTDRALAQTGLIDIVRAALPAATDTRVCTTSVGEPSLPSVTALLEDIASDGPLGTIVGVGGGSVLDSAKLATGALRTGATLRDLVDGRFTGTHAATCLLVLVPTTAGTGSETNSFAVVHDPLAHRKVVVQSDVLAADLAISDADLTAALPPAVTAATGFDALTHAVEALCSRGATPLTDMIAIRSLHLLSGYLLSAFEKPDEKSRGAVMEAATLAGMAFGTAGLGACHALSGPLGSVANIAHGAANALLLDAVVEFNSPVLQDKGDLLADGLRCRVGAASRTIAELRDRLGLPARISEVGLQRSELPQILDGAMRSPQIASNPRQADRSDLAGILEARY